jgi:hypothetical protein
VAARAKAWTAFARSNTGVPGSNPILSTNICRFYSILALPCVGRGLARRWLAAQGSYRLRIRLRNWKKRPGPTLGCRAISSSSNSNIGIEMGQNWRPFIKGHRIRSIRIPYLRALSCIMASPHFTATSPSDATVPGANHFIVRKIFNFGADVLTAIIMNSYIIWVVTQCRSPCFEGNVVCIFRVER